MLNEVKKRLSSLGISTSIEDEAILNFSIDKVKNHIKSQTNLKEIPETLTQIAIDKVTEEFLFIKKSIGQLNVETLDFSLVAKQVQDGDTNVSFVVDESMTPEGRFNALLDYLRHADTDFTKYRVLSW